MEAATEWMKHNDDQVQLRTMMRRTACYRRHFIQPTNNAKRPDVTLILKKFPHLFDNGMVSKCWSTSLLS